MYGIDISNWQSGIRLNNVPADFVIIKATQGTRYISPDFRRQYNEAFGANRLIGLYHYFSGGNPKQEADHFLKTIGNRVGKALLVLDWENIQNKDFANGPAKAKAWLDYVRKRTGVTPVIYTGKAETRTHDYTEIAKVYPLWGAQYPNYHTRGYEAPWRDGKNWGAWGSEDNLLIRQFTSKGRLKGYKGDLDLNYSPITKEAWEDLARGRTHMRPEKPHTPSGSIRDLTYRTLKGEFGNGATRKKNLGSKYTKVQARINHVANASLSLLTSETLRGDYGTGDMRKVLLGHRYKTVQKNINTYMSKKNLDAVAKAVIRGEYGNGMIRKRRLRAKGYDPDKVQKRVNALLRS